MSRILEVIEQVKQREAEGALIVARAREEAALLAARADEEGRVEHKRISREAREESERLLRAGDAETAAIRDRGAADTRETLRLLEHGIDERVRRTADHLLDLFRREYGPEGERT